MNPRSCKNKHKNNNCSGSSNNKVLMMRSCRMGMEARDQMACTAHVLDTPRRPGVPACQSLTAGSHAYGYERAGQTVAWRWQVRPAAAVLLAVAIFLTASTQTAEAEVLSATCSVSDWSAWTNCPCGGGLRTRTRVQTSSGGAGACRGVSFIGVQSCFGDGSSACHASPTCKTLLTENPGLPDGTYWLLGDARVTPFRAYCDMTTAGGGWTLLVAASGAEKGSWAALSAARPTYAPAVSTTPVPFTSPTLAGSLDFVVFNRTTTLMIQDVGTWAKGGFSLVQFQQPATAMSVLRSLWLGRSLPCTTLALGERFFFKSSLGTQYFATDYTLLDSGRGFGWGDCDPPLPATDSPASDIEASPRRWLARDSEGALIAVGGYNAGDVRAAARLFVREDVMDADCIVGEWTAWTGCAGPCPGVQSRTRYTVAMASGNGAACPALSESRACVAECSQGCPVCRASFAVNASICHHLAAPSVCMPTYDGTSTCPSGTAACKVLTGTSTGLVPASQCTGCWPSTRGECQQSNSVCYAQANDRSCPSGTYKCADHGSLPPPLLVILDITIEGLTTSAFEQRKASLVAIMAAVSLLPARQLVVESVVAAPCARSAVLSCVRVGMALVTPSPEQQSSAASAFQEWIVSGRLAPLMGVMNVTLNVEPICVTATGAVLLSDLHGSDNSGGAQEQPTTVSAPASWWASYGFIGGIGGALCALALIVAVLVGVQRHRTTLVSPLRGQDVVRVPQKPAFIMSPTSGMYRTTSQRSLMSSPYPLAHVVREPEMDPHAATIEDPDVEQQAAAHEAADAYTHLIPMSGDADDGVLEFKSYPSTPGPLETLVEKFTPGSGTSSHSRSSSVVSNPEQEIHVAEVQPIAFPVRDEDGDEQYLGHADNGPGPLSPNTACRLLSFDHE